jgi:ABC-2 type transport system permease protein
MNSLKDELRYFFSGEGMPYGKVSLMVIVVVTSIFMACFSNNYIEKGKIAVIDIDNSKYSHEFIDEMNASSYIHVDKVLNMPVNPQTLFYQTRHLAVVYLPKGFEKNRYSMSANNIGVFYDNTNLSQSSNIKEALNAIVATENAKIGSEQIQALGMSSDQASGVMSNISLNNRELFNPVGSYDDTVVIGFMLFFSSVFFTLAVIGIIPRLRLEHKWEMELLMGSPFATMLRLVPYTLCFVGANVVGLVMLRLIGDLKFEGSFLLFLPSMFILAASLGILAMFLGWNAPNPGMASGRMIFIVPAGFIFSGMTIPVDFYPHWVQVGSHFFPLLWVYKFTKDIIMRGASFWDCASEYGGFLIYLGIFAAIFSLRFFRQRQKMLLVLDAADSKNI